MNYKHTRSDTKCVRLRMSMGMEGYGIYCCLLEMLESTQGRTMESDYEAIAYELHCDAAKVERVVTEFGLFFVTDEAFSLEKPKMSTKERATLAANAKWGNRQPEAHNGQMSLFIDCDVPNTDPSKKSEAEAGVQSTCPPKAEAVQKANRFAKPTKEQVEDYCREHGKSINVEAFISYYESNGWRVGKNPMKSWQAAVNTWYQNDKKNAVSYGRGQPQNKSSGIHEALPTEGFRDRGL